MPWSLVQVQHGAPLNTKMYKTLSILTLVVAISACGGGGSEPPDLSNWAEAVASTTSLQRSELVYSNVVFKPESVCGVATNIYNFNDFNTFHYNGIRVTWGKDAVELCAK